VWSYPHQHPYHFQTCPRRRDRFVSVQGSMLLTSSLQASITATNSNEHLKEESRHD
jgi:hypothetical protein